MVSILLGSINARYTHTNLAIRSIAAYIQRESATWKEKPHLRLEEWSINQPLEEIVRTICSVRAVLPQKKAQTPQLILFSVYLWNAELTYKAAATVRKILPDAVIGFGGPEVSYQPQKVLRDCPVADFITIGEGELTTTELVHTALVSDTRQDFLHRLPDIAGLYLPTAGFTSPRPLIEDLGSVPFVYTPGAVPETRDIKDCIVYYESSRGCPFSCSYCLSAIEKTVRYVPLSRVLNDISFFLENNFRLIKFVDRTFNLDPQRYLAIWQHIIANHNGVTAFHFEIEAHALCEESFELLARAPNGCIQFEIGIQSTNEQTLQAVHRTTDFERIAAIVRRIPSNIHVHLDLIAGLPHENISSFARSYDFTAALKPEQLQLGFLKVLAGAPICADTDAPNWQYLDTPPYEVLQTPDLPYADIQKLKAIEHLTEIFYNSGAFATVIRTISAQESLFAFFSCFVSFLEQTDSLYTARRQTDWFSCLAEFLKARAEKDDSDSAKKAQTAIYFELLRFDFIRQAKTSTFPAWYERRYHKEAHAAALFAHTHVSSTRESYALSDYEEFAVNPLTTPPEAEAVQILFLFAGKAEKSTHNYTTGSKTRCILLTRE